MHVEMHWQALHEKYQVCTLIRLHAGLPESGFCRLRCNTSLRGEDLFCRILSCSLLLKSDTSDCEPLLHCVSSVTVSAQLAEASLAHSAVVSVLYASSVASSGCGLAAVVAGVLSGAGCKGSERSEACVS